MKLWLHSKLLGCFHDWSGLRSSLPGNPGPALHRLSPVAYRLQPYPTLPRRQRAAPCSRRLPRGPAPSRLPRSVSSPSNSSARLSPIPDFSLHPKPRFTYESRCQRDPPSRRSGISELSKHDSAPTPVAEASRLRPLRIGTAPKMLCSPPYCPTPPRLPRRLGSAAWSGGSAPLARLGSPTSGRT